MKLPVLFALVASLTGGATYFGVAGLGHSTSNTAAAAVVARDTTPSAADFARALTGASNQFAGGRVIRNTHCVKASAAHYMCAYAVVQPTGDECHLMQGMWTPGEASTITVTLAGRAGRCDSVRAAVQSLG